MGRKRKGDEPETNGHANGVALAEPVENPAPEVSNGSPAESAAVPKQRPVVSFSAKSDKTTRLELAVWPRVVKVSDQEEYTVYSMTLTRSWCDGDKKWSQNTFYRVHDIPVLQFLIGQAYAWCVARRLDVRFGDSDEQIPF